MEEKKKSVLVTFDIDGTLIRSIGPNSNQLHRQAFAHSFLHVFGIHGTIDVIQHHGSTDPAILINTLVHYGIPSEVATEKLSDLKSAMIEYAKDHAKDIGEGIEVLPGVESLLQALSLKDSVFIGLASVLTDMLFVHTPTIYRELFGCLPSVLKVTGNLEEIAWMKMKGLGIEKYFSVPHLGGFGSDHIDRGHLVKIAAERAEKLFPGKFDLRVHVGDTPNDIQAAEFGGALAVGVCTGIFGKEELGKASSRGAVILQNLSVSESFLHLLGV